MQLFKKDFEKLFTEIETRANIAQPHDWVAQYEIDSAKRKKKPFDLEAIKERLNTFIDLKRYLFRAVDQAAKLAKMNENA